MRKLLLFGLLALASCAHPQSQPKPESEPIGLDTPPADTTKDREFVRINPEHPGEGGRSADSVIVEVHRSLIDRVFNRQPEVNKYLSPSSVKAGKKSTVSVYYGPATVTTTTVGKKATAGVGDGAVASVTGKKSGPAVVASDSATLNNAGAGGNVAAVNGDNNDLKQTAVPPPPKPGFLDGLKTAGKAVAWAVGIGVIGLVLYETWPLLLAWFRRRKSTNNEA